MIKRGLLSQLGAASVAALFACTTAAAFQPRAPAPIMPGSIHTAEPPPVHASPAGKPAAEQAAEMEKPTGEKAAAATPPAETPPVKAEPPTKAEPQMKAEAPTMDAHPAPAVAETHGAAGAPVYPVEVLKALLEGNKRYASSKLTSPNSGADRRAETAQAQHPAAIIVSCSDSRVPPELIFDQGIGDLFVIRTAGEVVDDVALGSIEYAVEHLHTKLIFVLGHERCGAVTAALAGGEPGGHVGKIVTMIKPAIDKAKEKEGDKLTNCVNANVKLVAETIKSSEPIISELVKDGVVRVVGGYYDLDTGVVSIVYSPDLSL